MIKRRFIDIGANLIDSMYSGIYHGKTVHESDLDSVLKRAWTFGLEKIIITGTSLEDSKQAYLLSKTDSRLFCTVGCHPTQCLDFEKPDYISPDDYADKLYQLYKDCGSKVRAFGEIGLDFDRLNFCNKEQQIKYFEKQLTVAENLEVPLFLHCRAAFFDLCEILRNRDQRFTGVVHSFDGTIEDAKNIIDLGFFIGLNGCSLKTNENLETVKNIPSNRILIETDAPWCDIKPSHAGYKYVSSKFDTVKKEKWREGTMVKGRNEPCTIGQVLEIVSAIKQEDVDDLADEIFKNTLNLFFTDETSSEPSENCN